MPQQRLGSRQCPHSLPRYGRSSRRLPAERHMQPTRRAPRPDLSRALYIRRSWHEHHSRVDHAGCGAHPALQVGAAVTLLCAGSCAERRWKLECVGLCRGLWGAAARAAAGLPEPPETANAKRFDADRGQSSVLITCAVLSIVDLARSSTAVVDLLYTHPGSVEPAAVNA